jgi:hypothetical protein
MYMGNLVGFTLQGKAHRQAAVGLLAGRAGASLMAMDFYGCFMAKALVL